MLHRDRQRIVYSLDQLHKQRSLDQFHHRTRDTKGTRVGITDLGDLNQEKEDNDPRLDSNEEAIMIPKINFGSNSKYLTYGMN